jgi:hypothetical protein
VAEKMGPMSYLSEGKIEVLAKVGRRMADYKTVGKAV